MKKIIIIANILFFALMGTKLWFKQPSQKLENYIARNCEAGSLTFSQYCDCDTVMLANSYGAKQEIRNTGYRNARRLVISDYNEYIYVFLISDKRIVEFARVEDAESYQLLRKYIDQQYAGNYTFE